MHQSKKKNGLAFGIGLCGGGVVVRGLRREIENSIPFFYIYMKRFRPWGLTWLDLGEEEWCYLANTGSSGCADNATTASS